MAQCECSDVEKMKTKNCGCWMSQYRKKTWIHVWKLIFSGMGGHMDKGFQQPWFQKTMVFWVIKRLRTSHASIKNKEKEIVMSILLERTLLYAEREQSIWVAYVRVPTLSSETSSTSYHSRRATYSRETVNSLLHTNPRLVSPSNNIRYTSTTVPA